MYRSGSRLPYLLGWLTRTTTGRFWTCRLVPRFYGFPFCTLPPDRMPAGTPTYLPTALPVCVPPHTYPQRYGSPWMYAGLPTTPYPADYDSTGFYLPTLLYCLPPASSRAARPGCGAYACVLDDLSAGGSYLLHFYVRLTYLGHRAALRAGGCVVTTLVTFTTAYHLHLPLPRFTAVLFPRTRWRFTAFALPRGWYQRSLWRFTTYTRAPYPCRVRSGGSALDWFLPPDAFTARIACWFPAVTACLTRYFQLVRTCNGVRALYGLRFYPLPAVTCTPRYDWFYAPDYYLCGPLPACLINLIDCSGWTTPPYRPRQHARVPTLADCYRTRSPLPARAFTPAAVALPSVRFLTVLHLGLPYLTRRTPTTTTACWILHTTTWFCVSGPHHHRGFAWTRHVCATAAHALRFTCGLWFLYTATPGSHRIAGHYHHTTTAGSQFHPDADVPLQLTLRTVLPACGLPTQLNTFYIPGRFIAYAAGWLPPAAPHALPFCLPCLPVSRQRYYSGPCHAPSWIPASVLQFPGSATHTLRFGYTELHT